MKDNHGDSGRENILLPNPRALLDRAGSGVIF